MLLQYRPQVRVERDIVSSSGVVRGRVGVASLLLLRLRLRLRLLVAHRRCWRGSGPCQGLLLLLLLMKGVMNVPGGFVLSNGA